MRPNRSGASVRLAQTVRWLAKTGARRLPSLAHRVAPLGSRRNRWYIQLTHKSWATSRPLPTPCFPESYVPSTKDIHLPVPNEYPVVSIVIPAHNGVEVTARCLAAIALAQTATSFEVIVVDDASTDSTNDFLAAVPNLTLVTHRHNVGYLKSCNAGLARARGIYTLLLNNDTLVGERWLDAMIQTALGSGKPTAVGAKLVYPDGALQEAGAIVWSDGSGWNYGRGDDPAAFSYEYVREVDYCSAACLLVPTDLFRQVGGFDEQYSPAYYEDTDLAFSLRAVGGRVVYQPRAVVVHLEGASHGTATSDGVKRFQVRNKPRFVAKWATELRHQHPADEAHVAVARDRRPGFRAVVFDDKVPTPDRDSGSVRMAAMLQVLGELGALVTFVPANFTKAEPYTDRLQQDGVEVVYAPARLEKHLAALGKRVEICVLSRPDVAAAYLPTVRRLLPSATVLYDAVDLHLLREERRAQLEGTRRAHRRAARVRSRELGVVRSADFTIAVSDEEAAMLRREVGGASIGVLPNVHSTPPPTSRLAGRAGLLFVGGFQHKPNEDAVIHLATTLMPMLRAVLPGVHLRVVGAGALESVHHLAAPDIEVIGWVPDLTALYASSRVFVAPLRYGAGMKGKIGESMAHGLPVVTSPIGAEGFGLTNGEHLLVADNPAGFVEQVRRVYTEDLLWHALSRQGRSFIESNFSLDRARCRLRAILRDLKVLSP